MNCKGGEWYVRTGDQDDEQRLMLEVDEFDHTRLPAYVVLTSHPTDATDGVAIYLDEITSESEAWDVLQQTITELRNSIDEDTDTTELAERLKQAASKTERPLAMTAKAIAVIQFGVSVVPN